MKIKVAEATNIQLDWLVANIEGMSWLFEAGGVGSPPGASYSTDWSLGGPIIEREKIGIDYYALPQTTPVWLSVMAGTTSNEEGPTPLIAAMRCLVSSELGDEVEVPDELIVTKAP